MLNGDLQVGVLVALVLYSRRFFQPVDEIANFYNAFQSAVAALEKIANLLAMQPHVKEAESPTPPTPATRRKEGRRTTAGTPNVPGPPTSARATFRPDFVRRGRFLRPSRGRPVRGAAPGP